MGKKGRGRPPKNIERGKARLIKLPKASDDKLAVMLEIGLYGSATDAVADALEFFYDTNSDKIKKIKEDFERSGGYKDKLSDIRYKVGKENEEDEE